MEALKQYEWKEIENLGRWNRGIRRAYLLYDRKKECSLFLKVYEIGRSKKFLNDAQREANNIKLITVFLDISNNI